MVTLSEHYYLENFILSSIRVLKEEASKHMKLLTIKYNNEDYVKLKDLLLDAVYDIESFYFAYFDLSTDTQDELQSFFSTYGETFLRSDPIVNLGLKYIRLKNLHKTPYTLRESLEVLSLGDTDIIIQTVYLLYHSVYQYMREYLASYLIDYLLYFNTERVEPKTLDYKKFFSLLEFEYFLLNFDFQRVLGSKVLVENTSIITSKLDDIVKIFESLDQHYDIFFTNLTDYKHLEELDNIASLALRNLIDYNNIDQDTFQDRSKQKLLFEDLISVVLEALEDIVTHTIIEKLTDTDKTQYFYLPLRYAIEDNYIFKHSRLDSETSYLDAQSFLQRDIKFYNPYKYIIRLVTLVDSTLDFKYK